LKIDHIAMYVQNLEKSKDFFVKYFNGVSNGGYHNPNTGLRTYFITFQDKLRLEIMNRPDMSDKEKSLMQTGYIHIGSA